MAFGAGEGAGYQEGDRRERFKGAARKGSVYLEEKRRILRI